MTHSGLTCSDCGLHGVVNGTRYLDADGRRTNYQQAKTFVEYEICELCGHWQSLGRANDTPTAVAIEIRAAELSDLAGSQSTSMESWGWFAFSLDSDPMYYSGTDYQWSAGWLGRCIAMHDEEQGR